MWCRGLPLICRAALLGLCSGGGGGLGRAAFFGEQLYDDLAVDLQKLHVRRVEGDDLVGVGRGLVDCGEDDLGVVTVDRQADLRDRARVDLVRVRVRLGLGLGLGFLRVRVSSG